MPDEPEISTIYEAHDPEYLSGLEPVSIRARDLLALICLHGGGSPPEPAPDLPALYQRLLADPDTPVQLTAAFDCNGGPFQFPRADSAYQRRLDLHVLQRLWLVPGDCRTFRELMRRAGVMLTSLEGMCVFEEPTANWPSWPAEAVAAYAQGLQNPVPDPQTEDCRREVKLISVAEIETADSLALRPHHMMCILCFYGGGATGPIPGDNLWEPIERMKAQPDIPVTLVEGDCMVCPPCAGHDPRSGTCIRLCGLKDRRKDLDTFQLLDLLPGDRLPARELVARYVERVPHITSVCHYSEAGKCPPEWQPCGSATSGRYEQGLARLAAELGLIG